MRKIVIIIIGLVVFGFTQAQDKKIQYGGSFGVNFANNSTLLGISPTVLYNFNPYCSLGLGLQYNYINNNNLFNSQIFGGRIIGLVNPTNEFQMSAELEQSKVFQNNKAIHSSTDFWNTALFLGAGYRLNNATVGIRYNVLFKNENHMYASAWAPFVSVYF